MTKIEFLADRTEFSEEVAGIFFEEWGKHIPGNTLEQAKQRVRFVLNRDRLPLSIVCSDGDTLVGVYSLMPSDQANSRNLSPWLGSVFVKPEFRGKGIGSQLVEHAIDLAKKLGSETLYLNTKDKQAMYSRLGFEPLYEAVVNSDPVTVMSRAT